MFELNKYVLNKVSFDRSLFQKELSKAIKLLEHKDRLALRTWCQGNFGHYSGIVNEVFNDPANEHAARKI